MSASVFRFHARELYSSSAPAHGSCSATLLRSRHTFTHSRHVPRLARAVAGGGRRRSAGAAAHSGFLGRMYVEAVLLRRREMVTDLCSRIRRGGPHLYIQWEAAE